MLFVSHTAAPSGAELAFARLAKALIERGVELSVVLLATGPLVDHLSRQSIPTQVIPARARATTRSVGLIDLVLGALEMVRDGVAVGRHARAANVSVIVAQSTRSLLTAAVAARWARIPLVWQVHDLLSREHFGRKAELLRVAGRLLVSGFAVNSAATLATIRSGHAPVVVCHPGIDRTVIPEPTAQRPAAEVRVVMLGRIAPWKGQHLVLRAVSQMSLQPTVRIVGGTHFGEASYRAELGQLAVALGICDRVQFVDHTDDPLAELRAADVAVHYSAKTEPFGQVVVEAMACSCAVLAAAEGGPAEIVESEVSGILVPPRRPDLLAQELDRTVADWDLRLALSRAASDRAQDFGIETSAAVFQSLLERVVPK